MRDEDSDLDKRKSQNKIYILFMAVLATDECWPKDWCLGVQQKKGKAGKKKVRAVFPYPHTQCWPVASYSWLPQ